MAIERIAFRLGRNDEEPNIALAEELAASGDKKGIAEIVSGLDDRDDHVSNDCVKVLYELGYRKPQLIAPYVEVFLRLIDGKNQRRMWGGMTALASIAELKAREIFERRKSVIAALTGKSVIAADQAVSVLAGLCRADGACKKELFPVLLDHLEACRPKEIAQHAERTAVCVGKDDIGPFRKILDTRVDDMTPPQKARIDKLLRRLEKNT